MIEAPALQTVTFKGVDFALAEDTRPATFVLGLRKCGSSLLNQMMKVIARRNQVNFVDLPGTFFNAGIKLEEWQDGDLSQVVRPGNMYIGFRACPPAFARDPVFAVSRRVFMFRDPRDALVSQYFSDAYSHSLPSGTTEAARKARADFIAKRERVLASTIDDFVLREAPSLNHAFMGYAQVLASPLTLALRYEEHIFQKKRMLVKIGEHLELAVKKPAIEKILSQFDILPQAEDHRQFIRGVIPGDHRRKLKPDTIDRLDVILRPSLALFDYH